MQNPKQKEVSFALQVVHRGVLGLRGKHFFDLFADQYAWWNQICQRPDDEDYAIIKKEKLQERVLVLTPAAYWRNTELFADRVLLFDEAETAIREQIFAPSEKISLLTLLEKEQTATASAFAVAGIVRNVIAPQTKGPIDKYPVKIQLSSSQLATVLTFFDSLAETKEIKALSAWLGEITDTQKIFIEYSPRYGSLSFTRWSQEKVKQSAQVFHSQPTALFHRHLGANRFFSFWTGIKAFNYEEVDALMRDKKVTISVLPAGARSPRLPAQAADVLCQKLQTQNRVGVICSSTDHLFKLGEAINQQGTDGFELLGERLSGSNGKILSKLKARPSRLLFLSQKLLRPELLDLPFDEIVVYSFPFLGPHPLLDSLQDEAKSRGISFWDVWTMPQTAANLSRRVSAFSSDKVTIIDPRASAGWGETLIRITFPPHFFDF